LLRVPRHRPPTSVGRENHNGSNNSRLCHKPTTGPPSS
jgi:hypothetical protein